MLFDNTVYFGRVADPSVNDSVVKEIRALHEKIMNDDRVVASTLPLADGLTIVLKL
jgi:O-methyltransferase